MQLIFGGCDWIKLFLVLEKQLFGASNHGISIKLCTCLQFLGALFCLSDLQTLQTVWLSLTALINPTYKTVRRPFPVKKSKPVFYFIFFFFAACPAWNELKKPYIILTVLIFKGKLQSCILDMAETFFKVTLVCSRLFCCQVNEIILKFPHQI